LCRGKRQEGTGGNLQDLLVERLRHEGPGNKETQREWQTSSIRDTQCCAAQLGKALLQCDDIKAELHEVIFSCTQQE
jgi:hypothetical protein